MSPERSPSAVQWKRASAMRGVKEGIHQNMHAGFIGHVVCMYVMYVRPVAQNNEVCM